MKTKLDRDELPIEYIVNDVSKRLKLAILREEEAKSLEGGTQETELINFYTLSPSGKSVVGLFPRIKGQKI